MRYKTMIYTAVILVMVTIVAVAAPATVNFVNTAIASILPSASGDVNYNNGPAKEIPEFSTVAIPVATAIGLLFFFQHKKRLHKK